MSTHRLGFKIFMGEKKILAIPGDGIGKEIVPAALEVLKIVVPDLDIHLADAGFELWKKCGESISTRLLQMTTQVDGIVFGCTGTPSPPPNGYRSPILAIRKHLNLDINLRYCRSFDGAIDIVMVRNISEGLYCQREHKIRDGMYAKHVVTHIPTERVARVAIQAARRRKGLVTIVHKANVLQTDALFRKICINTCEAEGISWSEVLSDAAGYHLVLNPTRFDTMLMTSHVGDLLSDVGAAVVGGLGIVPSLSLGGDIPLVEPIHGSAPDIVGLGIADPIATLLSICLLLDFLEQEKGAILRRAVNSHLAAYPRPLVRQLTTESITKDIIGRLEE